MYSIYKIYKGEALVYVTYHTLNPDMNDKAKLDIILSNPTVPLHIAEDYFKFPTLFTILTHQTGITNALEASTEVLKLQFEDNTKDIIKAAPKAKATRKSGTKKAQQSKTEG